MFSSTLVFFVSAIFILTAQAVARPDFLYHFCNYTTNSTYGANLNDLLFSLSSTTEIDHGFFHSAYGQNSNPVFAIGLCRGDVNPNVCRGCLNNAASLLLERCPQQKEAIGWYDECMLRYSNRSIFSTMEEEPSKFLWNTMDITEPDRFRKLVEATLNDSVPRAANASSGDKKFAVKEASFTELQTLYSLVQCTPDISSSDCNMCLRRAMANLPMCCDGKQGGRVLYPSCNLRYETYQFYQIQSVPTPSPSPSPSPTQTPMLLPPASHLPAPAAGQVRRPEIGIFIVVLAAAFAALIIITTGVRVSVKAILKNNRSLSLLDQKFNQLGKKLSSMIFCNSRKKKDGSFVSTPINEEKGIQELIAQPLPRSDDDAVMPSSSTSEFE
ncbi:cysteine-rich repeat secretory protein 38-like [Alnus glutinosa]|uniref:cysteine-rich repeat secretory protein 38-like n=1 Tax=Alnus glutinosa TaxID=3517 RepID=UPI002D79A036|nr:cysteine-rich repeat secretory protein 38-like [Alnus glutinosa]